jgi:hypothetical protein
MAAAPATAAAAAALATLCRRLTAEGHAPRFDILAHSAGTIVVNKAAGMLVEDEAAVRFGHVLFLGTPHDPAVDLGALERLSAAVLNLHSPFDKVNRSVSGAGGALTDLDGPPFWNQRLDTTLSGRPMRHYTFLEDTPETWLAYSDFLRAGRWPRPRPPAGETELTAASLYRVAAWAAMTKPTAADRKDLSRLARRALASTDAELATYGAILAGRSGDPSLRELLKARLDIPDVPVWLRWELYQALGHLGDGRDLRYLQAARKRDPAAAEVLRDILRDWHRRRIRPPRPQR